jgi:hypothetical protein
MIPPMPGGNPELVAATIPEIEVDLLARVLSTTEARVRHGEPAWFAQIALPDSEIAIYTPCMGLAAWFGCSLR